MSKIPITRLRGAALFALALAFGAGAAAEPGVAANELVIGQNITLQGGRNGYGVEVLAGVRTLLDDVNRSGGVNGRRILLRTLDDDNQPAKAEANARRLVDDGVCGPLTIAALKKYGVTF